LSQISTKVKARVNIDPANEIAPVIIASDYRKIQSKFTSDIYLEQDLPLPKIIFSIAMFYHLTDPLLFCEHIKKIMNEDTVWCLQMTYLGSMLANNAYDNIVHEHVAFYSLKSLEYLLTKIDLEIFHAKIVGSYGGSLRVFIQKKHNSKRPPTVELEALRAEEEKLNINSEYAIKSFNERIQLLKEVTYNWIDNISNHYGPMTGIGASTKGGMICQFIGINTKHINLILDNNPKKIGSYLLGSNIPIKNENEYWDKLSDYVFLLPYYYSSYFLNLVNNLTRNGNARYMFVPLPQPLTIKFK